MKSRIFVGKTTHARIKPIPHRFVYPVIFYCIDLDEIEALDQKNFLFGYNKFRPLSIYDEDYLQEGEGSIRQKLIQTLVQNDCTDPIERIEIITAPRYLNYVFNPATFYYCYDKGDSLKYAILEINNTFKEKHIYIWKDPLEPRPKMIGHYRQAKSFHVSPFNDMKGDYDFHCSDIQENLNIHINLLKGDTLWFHAKVEGKAFPFHVWQMIKIYGRYPLTAFLTMPRILWQAAKLHYLRRLPVFTKPHPISPLTLRIARPTLLQNLCMRLTKAFFKKMKKGFLEITLPHGQKWQYGSENSHLRADLTIKTYELFPKLVFGGDIAFGETYMNGDWESLDLPRLMRFFAENYDKADDGKLKSALLNRFIHALRHFRRANTIKGSQKNIHDHYDLSNRLFSLFLDPSMTYSCALFKTPHESLEEAQQNKIDTLIEKVQIKESDHVLEIGCGWGSFAIQAVKKTGSKITGITISEEQYQFAKNRVREEGLDHQIEILFCDYRNLKGQFDKIVSIEMIEAVGEEFMPEFFSVCERLLKPGGLMALQVITISQKRFVHYRKRCDWIQKYIFPGSFIPSHAHLAEIISTNSRLSIKDVDNIGMYYVQTLQNWHQNFNQAKKQLQLMGYEERFQKMFEFYFSWCEAGFASRSLDDLQLVLEKPLDIEEELRKPLWQRQPLYCKNQMMTRR